MDVDETVLGSRWNRWNGHKDAVPLIEVDRPLSFLLEQFEDDVVFRVFAVKSVDLAIGNRCQHNLANV